MANDKLVNREVLKKVREKLQQKIEQGLIIAGKAQLAQQLENISDESGSYQEKPFIFQGTGTDSNTAETPTAPIAKHLELRGNTVVFNQLVDTNTTEIIPTVGHKYLTMINGVKSIITPADDTPISVTGGTDNIFDLTRMFGTGNEPTSVVQFNRLFPLPYYAYNAGQLLSCKSNKLVPIGYNQLDAQDEFIRVVAGQTYRLMYWNGTALAALTSGSIVEYAGDKTTVLKTTTYDNLSDLHTVDNTYPDNGDKGIKLTDETQWVKITGSSNTNILFNLAWDGSRSDFEAFVKHEYTLPSVELKSAGSAYDSYYPDGRKIQRVTSVDLGDIDWGYYETRHLFYADFTLSVNITNDTVYNIVCPIYETKSLNALRYDQGKTGTGICIGFPFTDSGVRICIRDDGYNGDTSAFKTAMSGVMANYELATPIETIGQTFAENVEVDDFGTMWFTSSETESASNPIIPQGNRFFYPADYALLVDDLNNYTNGDVGLLLKNTQIKAGGAALVPDAYGSLNIPDAREIGWSYNSTDFGIMAVNNFSGLSIGGLSSGSGRAILWCKSTDDNAINTRNKTGGVIPRILTNDKLDAIVKAAMTDGVGAAWTDAEKAAGRARMGSAVALTQSTDLTPTTQTLTLSANTRYALGTLTALDLTFPTTNVNDGDEIIIGFISGSTATTLTLDNVNAIYNFSSCNADKFIELNAQYKVSINKWVVYSAETDYTVV